MSHGDAVVDFGCGTGGILTVLQCRSKIGIEINSKAAQIARAKGLAVLEDLMQLDSRSADVIISNHSLEHCADPLTVLQGLHRVLRDGGKLVVVVPSESPFRKRFRKWAPNPQNHLFSWTPMSLGNLLSLAGFQVESCALRSPAWAGRKIEKIPTKTLRRLALTTRDLVLGIGDVVGVAYRLESEAIDRGGRTPSGDNARA